MALAVWCSRHNYDGEMMEARGGFYPHYCNLLSLAEAYHCPKDFGVDFTKQVWLMRAQAWNLAQAKSWEFEEKK